MPTAAPGQFSFNGGELSPSLFGRLDSERYKSSLATCLNFIPMLQGPLDRRPGTYFVKEVKDSTKQTRIIRFEFSTTQAYILEFGNQYIRFYTNYGQVLSSGNPYEITSPFVTADLPSLSFTQKADVLYIAHPNYFPTKLLRYGATNWKLGSVTTIDGPYRLPMQVKSLAGPDVPNINSQLIASTSGSSLLLTADGGSTFSVSTCASSAGLIQVTTTAPHNFVTGQPVYITGVLGTIEANGSWDIDVVDASNFTLRGSAFVNAYSSAGTCYPIFFDNTSLPRIVRVLVSSVWYWGIAIHALSPYQAQILTAGYSSGIATGTTTSSWRLGTWYPNNYPATVTFHEDRLSYAGAPINPNGLDCSRSGNYENFAPTQTDGTVTDSNALSFTLNSNGVNALHWLSSDEKGLLGGSSSGEWIIRPSINQDAMTPTNISAKQTLSWGSATGVMAQTVGKATLFIQRGAKKIREMLFYFDIDGYRAGDLTELSEHITGTGLVDSAKQLLPYQLLWYVRADGALIALTYDREMQVLKVGWSRHILGGNSDAAGDAPIVESIACIPSPDGTRDDLWMIVRRRVNGSTKRYIEYMSKFFEDTDNKEDAHFVDCGGSYDLPISITGGVTQASPGVVTAAAHGLSNGDQVQIKGIVGMTQLNYNRYTVAGVTTNTFNLTDSSGNNIDTTAYSTYVSGGTVRKLVTTITGLTWLENETVDVLADGAVVKGLVVSNSGAIVLPNPTATAHIGYGYNSDAKMLPLEAGSADGTAMGKTRRTTRVSFMFHRSLGFKFGIGLGSADPVTLDTLNMRSDTVPNNQAAPLFSGLLQETIEADYDFYNQIFMRQDEPLPCKLLAVAVQMQTQDRR